MKITGIPAFCLPVSYIEMGKMKTAIVNKKRY